jgi:fatty acid desaturase
MRTLLGIIAFFALYAAADFVGSHIPEWVGYAFLISIIVACIAGLIKLGKVSR